MGVYTVEKLKSKVISFRISDPQLADFYEDHRELCLEKFKALLAEMSSGSGEEQAISESTSTRSQENSFSPEAIDLKRSLIDFQSDLDQMVRSGDFEDRMDGLQQQLTDVKGLVDELRSSMAMKSEVAEIMSRNFSSIRGIFLATLGLVIASVASIFILGR